MGLELGSPAGLWERVAADSATPAAGDAWGCRTLSHVSLDRLRIERAPYAVGVGIYGGEAFSPMK
jgi:peptidoglycan/xylan/chitin deacetylase (PgdA/CDA1 family)